MLLSGCVSEAWDVFIVLCCECLQTPGCAKSGLFKAFSDHVLTRLGVEQERNLEVGMCGVYFVFCPESLYYQSASKFILNFKVSTRSSNLFLPQNHTAAIS